MPLKVFFNSKQFSDLLLMLDYGIFYEFIPMDTFGTPNQKAIRLADVEMNKNYAIVVTTNSGLALPYW
jgi:hypothetical protein